LDQPAVPSDDNTNRHGRYLYSGRHNYLLQNNCLNRGLYLLWLQLKADKSICIGSLGLMYFPRGLYVYVGSAQRNRRARIERHLKLSKKQHWHIDYLREQAEIIDFNLLNGEKTDECLVAESLFRLGGERLFRFGSSDCKCPGHLLFFSSVSNPGLVMDKLPTFYNKGEVVTRRINHE
jgi:Uri superfamily endonuclease